MAPCVANYSLISNRCARVCIPKGASGRASRIKSTPVLHSPRVFGSPTSNNNNSSRKAVVMASSAALVVPADVFISAARVTAAYAILFVSLLVWQGISKLQLAKAAQAKKEPFDRYNDKRMLPYDRTIGNLVEWAVPFLCLFWLSMLLTNGATVKWGWLYVAARAAYPVLALNKGIGTVGAKGPILLSTFPGYVALIAFIIPVVKALL